MGYIVKAFVTFFIDLCNFHFYWNIKRFVLFFVFPTTFKLSFKLIFNNRMIIIIIFSIFLRFFFHKCDILLPLDMILVLPSLMVTFFFQNQLYFFACSLKEVQSFFTQLFPLFDQTPKLLTLNIHREYAHLFLMLNIFRIICTSIYFSNN